MALIIHATALTDSPKFFRDNGRNVHILATASLDGAKYFSNNLMRATAKMTQSILATA
jgi:hypothetical protein